MQAVDEGAKIIQFLVLALVPLSFLSAPSPILSLYLWPHTFCAHSWVFSVPLIGHPGIHSFIAYPLTLYCFSSFFIFFIPTSPYLQMLLISFIIRPILLVFSIIHQITLMQVEAYISHSSEKCYSSQPSTNIMETIIREIKNKTSCISTN